MWKTAAVRKKIGMIQVWLQKLARRLERPLRLGRLFFICGLLSQRERSKRKSNDGNNEKMHDRTECGAL